MNAGQRPFASLESVRAGARAALDEPTWAYLDGGAGAESTVEENRAAFARWHLLPRPLSGITEVHTTTEFLGLDLASPIVTGPVGTYTAFHEGGDVAVARAAQRFGTIAIVPVLSSYTLEHTARAAPRAARIFQVLASGPSEHYRGLATRAQAAGYGAICVTIDAYPRAVRDRIAASGFDLPTSAVGANYPSDPDTEMTSHVELNRHAWSWGTLAGLIEHSPLPVMVKGILTTETAVAAIEAGAQAIMVSNVGGRQLDGAPSSLEQLPAIVATVEGAVPIAFDSGVRRGTDVLKALALGADVVSIGRTAAMGLAAGGEDGVLAALELVHEELVTSMAVCGASDVRGLDGSILQLAGPPAPREVEVGR